MANSNPYLILRRVRDAAILQLRQLFIPENNTAVVPPFEYNYIESFSTGDIQFYGNPANGDTFIIGINTITFVSASPTGLQVLLGANQQITLANLVARINANSSTLLVSASTNSIPNKVSLKAITTGAGGNAITLAVNSTVLRVSGPNLSQGGLFDFDNSEIFIGDAIPQDYQDWPMIVVDTASANETRYLGPEDQNVVKNEFGVVIADNIFSSLVVNVNINVYTIDDTLARDNIIDLIYNNISEIRDQLASHGIEMIDRTMPTETRVFQDQRWYITNHFTLRVYCEWTDNLEITNVTGVNVTVPLTGPVPNITSDLFYDWIASADLPFTYLVTATNMPLSYSASGLPTGVSIDSSNGLITGTPTQTGTFYVLLGATNGNGTGTKPLTLTVS